MLRKLLFVPILCSLCLCGEAQPRKVFIDQDSRNAVGTDVYSVLILAQSPQVEVLGISITAGDGWAKEGTAAMLRALELTGHGNIPVAQGAEYPLLNSREETLYWESLWGKFNYKGAWNERNYHDASVIPPLTAGNPTIKPIAQHGALFLIETLRKYPGEVTVWVGGPFTTVALACRLDPEVPKLAKELVVMGSGMYGDKGGSHNVNSRREFNWWFDPEAARMVLSAPWKKITITPVDISVKTHFSDAIVDEIAKSSSATAQYISKYQRRGAGAGSFMWDEIAAAAWIDPSLITEQKTMLVNIDISHGPSYGQTIFLEEKTEVPSWMWQKAVVQFDLDKERFYKMFVDLMKR